MKALASTLIASILLSPGVLYRHDPDPNRGADSSADPPPKVMMAVTQRWFADTILAYELSRDDSLYVAVERVKAQGVFLRLRATFVNVTDSDLALRNEQDFTLIDESGTSYQVATPATITPRRTRYRETPGADVRAPPGETYDALLSFDIPRTDSDRDLQLRFRDDPPVSFAVQAE